MILITCIVTYIVSFIFARRFFILAKSENGRWSSLELDLSDVACVVLPIFNTFFAIDYIFGNYKDDWYENKEPNKFTKLFFKG